MSTVAATATAPAFRVELLPTAFRLLFPYDPKLVAAVKELPERRWSKSDRAWSVPLASAAALDQLLARIPGPIEYIDGAREAIDARIAALAQSREASRRTSLDIALPAPEGLDYLPYQRAGIAYGLDHPNVLFADEMGLGKTIQAIGVCNADASLKSILILCPASLRLNWLREWKKWYVHPHRVCIAEGRLPPSDVVIVNYDVLKKHIHEIHARQWDALICDEAHYLKNYKAQRTKLVLGDRKTRREANRSASSPHAHGHADPESADGSVDTRQQSGAGCL
jgi:hypothetical protein